MNTKLTAPMIKALGQARVANVSSNNFRIGTLTALEARGLVVLADRFASGACLFRITAKGIRTLVEVADRQLRDDVALLLDRRGGPQLRGHRDRRILRGRVQPVQPPPQGHDEALRAPESHEDPRECSGRGLLLPPAGTRPRSQRLQLEHEPEQASHAQLPPSFRVWKMVAGSYRVAW